MSKGRAWQVTAKVTSLAGNRIKEHTVLRGVRGDE